MLSTANHKIPRAICGVERRVKIPTGVSDIRVQVCKSQLSATVRTRASPKVNELSTRRHGPHEAAAPTAARTKRSAFRCRVAVR